ncbi:uncharacterized protein LOC123265869 [Cotesia glomerata]|uniref:Odorant receptor n=1 Tax=Cotesia glomerata TaxID=32391 RepID=A0AAV7IW12_COTGL|nr:uncharacterized protein LOC123265869 [Cotesia glomerata]KAH0569044.1 hypothetical protein KQX54_021750 [Cotesia glomerata]
MSDVESNQSNRNSSSVPLNLEVFATHDELIERVSHEIHSPWKWIPVLTYLASALTGYAASILFYLFWEDIFGGNCPLWATVEPPVHVRSMRSMDGSIINDNNNNEDIITDWRSKVLVTFLYKTHCQYFHFVCLCSCSFGIIWCMLFARCATGIFGAQWLIVPPVLIFQVIFTVVIYQAAYNYYQGFKSFTANLKLVSAKYMNVTEMAKYPLDCELAIHYLEIFNINTSHNLCKIQKLLQLIMSGMVWSWIGGLAFLIFRIIVVNDFRLLRTVAYKVPKNSILIKDDRDLEKVKPDPLRRKRKKQYKKLTYLLAQT